ncbi:hypothetical protein VTK26DRAFT_473 [Humicola hyalothermophila]
MDEFSDDVLDDLNDAVLQQLENNAIQFTQAQKLGQSQAPQTQHNLAAEYGFDEDDFDDTVVIDQHAQPPPMPPNENLKAFPIQPAATTQRWNQHIQPQRPSYPSRPQYPTPQRLGPQALPPQRYAPVPSARPHPPQQPQPSQFARPPPPGPRPYSAQPFPPSQALHAPGPSNQNEIIAALQARLSELQSDLTAARGEAAILRSKYDKAQATHDAEIARLKKQNAEQLAKQERLVEAARAAERTATTELQFARQDLREELGRAKSRRREGPATPKKNKPWGMGDGFDGVEILSSPSKGQSLRRKDSAPPPSERTPTKGKRKRPIVDSPTFALETHSEDDAFAGIPPADVQSCPSWVASGSLPFDFLRLVLDHTQIHGQPPTFDLFSRFAFPSEPDRTFSAIIFQKLPQLGNPREPLRLLADFAELIIDMWHRCLSEKYHAPIYYLAALALYTLELNAVEVAPHIISSLVPVCATTCRLVALPRFNSVDGNLAAHPDAVVRQLCIDIDVVQCLALLYLAALGCLSRPFEESAASDPSVPSPQTQFWRTMELDFVLMMLSPKHPEAEWLGMLSLLCTSVAPDSIGPIPSAATETSSGRAQVKDPRVVAATVIDCVSSFLCDPPRWATAGSSKEIVARTAALRALVIFATSPFGALQMACSDVAIPRLVTVLCWAIDQLYDVDVALPLKEAGKLHAGSGGSRTVNGDAMDLDKQEHGNDAGMQAGGGAGEDDLVDTLDDEPETEPDPVSLLCRFISQAIRLLHFLITDSRTADAANTAAKLAASHGGSQRHLLTLARLTFAYDDLVLEAGIDADTVELAHELLELAVTPDEGEVVAEMFGD